MHRLKLMLALLLLASCAVPLAGAAGIGTFSIEQKTVGVGVGQFGVATLYMDNTWTPPADSVSLYVGFDPTIIQYVSTDWKVGNSVAATPTGTNEIYFQFADYTNKYPSGRVEVADINFKGLAQGQSTLGIRIENVRSHVGISETEFTDMTASSLSNPGTFTVGAGGGGAVTTVPTVPGVTTPTVTTTQTTSPNETTTIVTVAPTETVTGNVTAPTTIMTAPPTTGPTGVTTVVPFVPPAGVGIDSDEYTGVLTRTPTVTVTRTATATATATPTGGTGSAQTIVQVAQANPNLSTLVSALQEAGLDQTLSGAGPYTVFAPTNAAFDRLPAGTLDALLADTTELTSVLTYHAASGRLMAVDLANRTSITTLQGSPLAINATGGRVRVDGANVTQADIQASNGVIHVIDAVMLPPAGNATPTATGTATTAAPTGTTPARTTVPVNTTATQAGLDLLPLAAAGLAGLALVAARRR
jgi:uncharacterized surface protein with fasciclin (FAS1) repeats